MKIGQRVKHPIYGEGTIIAIEDSIRLGDGSTWDKGSQSSIIRVTNGWSRYAGHLNVAVKFDNGGPQGFALDSTNELLVMMQPSAERVAELLKRQVIT